jgi:hypothetical protein
MSPTCIYRVSALAITISCVLVISDYPGRPCPLTFVIANSQVSNSQLPARHSLLVYNHPRRATHSIPPSASLDSNSHPAMSAVKAPQSAQKVLSLVCLATLSLSPIPQAS